MTASAAAATFYVGGPGALDTNSGTAGQPWATVTRALKAPDDSLVLVRPGEYPALAPPAGDDLVHDTPVTIRRAGYVPGEDPQTVPAAQKATIGSPATPSASLVGLPAVKGLRLEGLHFAQSLLFNGADGLAVTGSEIGPTHQHGLLFAKHSSSTYSVRNTSITGNWFHDSNQDQRTGAVPKAHGTMIGIQAATAFNQGNANLTIARNRFEGILDGDGIQLSGAANVTIDDNRILDGTVGAAFDHVDSIQILSPVTDLAIRRNFVGADIRGFILTQKSRRTCIMPDPQPPDCTTRVENVDWEFREFFSGPLGRIAIENNVLTGYDFSLRMYTAFDTRVAHNTFWASTFGTNKHGVNIGVGVTDPADGIPDEDEQLVFANNLMRDVTVDPEVSFAIRTANATTNNWSVPVAGEFYGVTPLFAAPGLAPSALDTVARDKGAPGLGVTSDHAGRARDAKPDIGAYEAAPPAVIKTVPRPVIPVPDETRPPTKGLAALTLPRSLTVGRNRKLSFVARCRTKAGCKAMRLTARARIGRRNVSFTLKVPQLSSGRRVVVRVKLSRSLVARLGRARTARFTVTGPRGSGFRTRAVRLRTAVS